METPHGRGWAIFVRDYGFDHVTDLWTCVAISGIRKFKLNSRDNPNQGSLIILTFGVIALADIAAANLRGLHSGCCANLRGSRGAHQGAKTPGE